MIAVASLTTFFPRVPVLEPRYTYRFCTSVRARFCCARVLVRRSLCPQSEIEGRYHAYHGERNRLEKVEELDMERLRARFRLEASAQGQESVGGIIDLDGLTGVNGVSRSSGDGAFWVTSEDRE